MKTTKHLLAVAVFFLALAGPLHAQAPGTITVSQSVQATAGTGNTAVVCTVAVVSKPLFSKICSIGGVVVDTTTATPSAGASSGYSSSFASAGNIVTVILTQPTAGALTWSVAANGTMQSGTF